MNPEEVLEQQQQNEQNGESGVQSQQQDQGNAGNQNAQEQDIDYEKAYKNLEPEFTKKSQELASLKAWKDFQEKTGITAEQALQQLEQYQSPQQGNYSNQANAQNFNDPMYAQQGYQPMSGLSQYQDPYAYQPHYEDPRVAHLEQQMQQMQQQQQVEKLRQKFPQFDEMYPDVLNLAQSQGLDLETAFGRLMVDKWDDFKSSTEQQVVERIRQKGLKTVETSNVGGNQDESVQLTEQEAAAARAMGISPQDYAKMKDVKYTID